VREEIEPIVPYDVDAVVRTVGEQYREWLATLIELVRIPSVSGDPTHKVDVERSADAVAAALEVAGLEHVRQRDVDGSPPYVLGEWVHRDDAPTVLLYAHPDVQPPGIVEHWPIRSSRASAAAASTDGVARTTRPAPSRTGPW